ncbi:MAG: DUF5071 domain-containing protein [Acidobacteriota bacterium]
MSREEALVQFVPKDKHDTATAQAAVQSGYPMVSPVLPELVAWLQDYNWPVAQVLAPFLATIGIALLPQVKAVLVSGDLIWKRWVLSCVVSESEELAQAVSAELVRLAYAATPSEREEDLDEIALGVVEQFALDQFSGGTRGTAERNKSH